MSTLPLNRKKNTPGNCNRRLRRILFNRDHLHDFNHIVKALRPLKLATMHPILPMCNSNVVLVLTRDLAAIPTFCFYFGRMGVYLSSSVCESV